MSIGIILGIIGGLISVVLFLGWELHGLRQEYQNATGKQNKRKIGFKALLLLFALCVGGALVCADYIEGKANDKRVGDVERSVAFDNQPVTLVTAKVRVVTKDVTRFRQGEFHGGNAPSLLFYFGGASLKTQKFDQYTSEVGSEFHFDVKNDTITRDLPDIVTVGSLRNTSPPNIQLSCFPAKQGIVTGDVTIFVNSVPFKKFSIPEQTTDEWREAKTVPMESAESRAR